MRLVTAEFHGYKRFSSTTDTRLNVDGKVIAIVGPNEAGKTSILDGLMTLNDDDPLPAVDLTRNEGVPSEGVIRARYWLDDDDIHAIQHLTSAPTQNRWFEIRKDEDGELRPRLERTIERDLSKRHRVAGRMQALGKHKWLHRFRTAESGPLRAANFDDLTRILARGTQRLPEEAPDRLRELAENLDGNRDNRAPKYATKLVADLQSLADDETTHPQDEAEAILLELRPRFLSFDEPRRELRHQENVDPQSEAPQPTPAFQSLTGAAGLSIPRYLRYLRSGQTGDAQFAIEQGNETLKREFAAWTQSGVRPRIHKGDGTTLQLHVDREAGGYMKIDERSSGLRIFIALVAMLITERTGVAPIILIDEAETHLHYDAQADLVRVFASQDSAAQIIYTTHSAGCLPEDLGSGVRIVDPVPGTNHSRIRNKFWVDEPGFSPLLLGMGASTLAFFPTRDAIVCEGPTEMILLGTLLREATRRPELGYQVAPGGAAAKPTHIGGLELSAPNVAWLVDGDGGGRELRKFYMRNSVSGSRIVIAGGSGSGLVIEDFVDAEIYLAAVNTELRRRRRRKEMPSSALSARDRPGSVTMWCGRNKIPVPSKVEIAHHIVLGQREHHRRICDPNRTPKLTDLDTRIRRILRIELSDLAPPPTGT